MKKLLLLAILTCNCATAQNFSVATAAHSDFQITRDEGGQKSCGARSMIVYNDPLQKNSARAIDFSLVIYSSFISAIKFGVLDANEINGQVTPLKRQDKIYLAFPTQNINLISENAIDSESENYTLATFKDTVSAMRILDAISMGGTMQVQIPRKADSMSTTVQFVAPFSIPEQQALKECLSNLIERIKKENNIK
ncbi:hypothetical protein [Undibacterium sp. Ji49W]|uniref:hypothetical protein n=1 Tax=Undibacterium sp. Ji49W TaxID=3413040 RepID=UPI003BF3B1F4